jgi:hypothetical protein
MDEKQSTDLDVKIGEISEIILDNARDGSEHLFALYVDERTFNFYLVFLSMNTKSSRIFCYGNLTGITKKEIVLSPKKLENDNENYIFDFTYRNIQNQKDMNVNWRFTYDDIPRVCDLLIHLDYTLVNKIPTNTWIKF